MPVLKYWDAATATWKTGDVGQASGQIYSQVIGDGVNSTFVVTHGFGTRNVIVAVYRNSPPYDEVEVDVERTDVNTVTIRTLPTIPAPSEYIVNVNSAGTQATLNIAMDTWHQVGAAGEPAFQNSWSNFDAARPVKFRKYPDGTVRFTGVIKGTTSGTVGFTLPAGYRPPVSQNHLAQQQPGGAGTYPAQVEVRANGDIAITGNPLWVFLDDIEFDTESVLQTASVAAQPMDPVHYVGGSGEPAFQGAWKNLDNNATVPGTGLQRSLRFRKYPDGRVRVMGVVYAGTTSTALFTLPVGYRPPITDTAFEVVASGGPAYVGIAGATGVVTPTSQTGNVTTWVYIDIEFDTESIGAYVMGSIGPPRVTTLPTNPVDGQECYYIADSVNGVVWHLKYNAGSSSAYKWEFVGGSPLFAFNDASGTFTGTSNVYQQVSGVVCNLALPLAGDYDIEAGARMTTLVANGGVNFSYDIGATPAASIDGAFAFVQAASFARPIDSVLRQRRKTGMTAGVVLTGKFMQTSATGTATVAEPTIRARPVRVG
jgi:hypothetical protein